MAKPFLQWYLLGDLYYRIIEIYQMAWDNVDLARYYTAVAPLGGPIARLPMTKDGAKPGRQFIIITSASGLPITADSTARVGSRVIKMGWTYSEHLICVLESGVAVVFDVFGSCLQTINLGQEAKEMRVLDAKIFLHDGVAGIAFMTATYSFYTMSNIQEERYKSCQEPPGLDAAPSSWLVLCQDRSTDIVVSVASDIYVANAADVTKVQLQGLSGQIPYQKIVIMACSVNFKYVSLFTDTGHLWIGSADFRNCYGVFDTAATSTPLDMVWCDNGAVVLNWGEEIQIVGPHCESVVLPLLSHACLATGIDGVRIITTKCHEHLQEVPLKTEEVFKIGSLAPGATLLDAMVEYEKGSSTADRYIRSIKKEGTLGKAVEQCIEAAGLEYDPILQRQLLKAASFGKGFIDGYSPQSFVNMSQILRILNNIRHYKIGMPITLREYQYLSLPVVIDRLILREQYALALQICDYLRLPEDTGKCRILAHWACRKVQQKKMDDKEIAAAIANKLRDVVGISYAAIASKAYAAGRLELAIKLLDHEPKADDQVPLLMEMKKDDMALNKAIESGDSDLIYMVIFRLRDNLQVREFFLTICRMPIALKMFEKYCREASDRRSLMDIADQCDQFDKKGMYIAQRSFTVIGTDERIEALEKAGRAFGATTNPICKKATEDHIRLLQLQSVLERDLRESFVELSLNETVFQLILLRQLKLADKMKKDFKIPDRRYWWIKVRALAQSRNWTELEKFSNSKKSPIGYEAFVDACVDNHDNTNEARKYISRVLPLKQSKCYMKIRDYDKAAAIAFQQKSIDDLVFLRVTVGNSNRTLFERINTMIAQLNT